MSEVLGYLMGAALAAMMCVDLVGDIRDEVRRRRRIRILDAIHDGAYRDAHSGGPHA